MNDNICKQRFTTLASDIKTISIKQETSKIGKTFFNLAANYGVYQSRLIGKMIFETYLIFQNFPQISARMRLIAFHNFFGNIIGENMYFLVGK
jgi:hypothetical protein